MKINSNSASGSFRGSSINDCVWIGGEELEMVEQALLPQLERTENALEGLLRDAVSLDVALTVWNLFLLHSFSSSASFHD